MIVLKKTTFDKMARAMKYPSITGGLGVRVDKQPGGGLSLNIPPVSDGGGLSVGGPGGFPPDDPYVEPPWVPPSDPYQPSSTS